MPPKRKSTAVTSNKTSSSEDAIKPKSKKTKTSKAVASSSSSAIVSIETMGEWMKKSASEFNLHIDSKADKDEGEWKAYYEKRKNAQKLHDKIVEADDFISMQGCLCEDMEGILSKIDALTVDNVSAIMSQFKFTFLDATLEDSSLEDMRSCKVETSVFSDHSFESIDLKFDYHFRVRGYGVEFFRNLKYSINTKPSEGKSRKTNWYSNNAKSEYEEDRKFGLSIRALERMKKILFRDSIQQHISNYQLIQLLTNSVGGQFGETGSVKDDDWIGYHSRLMCGCPTEEDKSYVAPTFEKPKKSSKGRRSRRNDSDSEDGDSDDFNSDNSYDSDDSDNERCMIQ